MNGLFPNLLWVTLEDNFDNFENPAWFITFCPKWEHLQLLTEKVSIAPSTKPFRKGPLNGPEILMTSNIPAKNHVESRDEVIKNAHFLPFHRVYNEYVLKTKDSTIYNLNGMI